MFLRDGWAQPEEWGVWGVGQSHTLKLFPPLPLASHVKIEFDVHVVLLGGRKAQQVDVLAGEQLLDTWAFTSDVNRAIRTLEVGACGF